MAGETNRAVRATEQWCRGCDGSTWLSERTFTNVVRDDREVHVCEDCGRQVERPVYYRCPPPEATEFIPHQY